MSKKVRCPFGKEIEKRLVDMDKSKKWLVDEVRKDTQKFFDAGYLQKILTGDKAPATVVASICKILAISKP